MSRTILTCPRCRKPLGWARRPARGSPLSLRPAVGVAAIQQEAPGVLLQCSCGCRITWDGIVIIPRDSVPATL